jgi:hypothetical protein
MPAFAGMTPEKLLKLAQRRSLCDCPRSLRRGKKLPHPMEPTPTRLQVSGSVTERRVVSQVGIEDRSSNASRLSDADREKTP